MSTKIKILPFLVAVLVLAACDANSGARLAENIEFRSIDEIIDVELEVTNFAADGTATLPIRTSVPVACTVVYGETPAFGQSSLDLDMQGGTHSEHNPLLSGLKPETTYFFRAQGVDDNGVVYLSALMTFETPAFDELAAEIENLASPLMGAEIIGYSSAFGGAELSARWGAGSAFDNNLNSEWSSAGDGDEAWVEVRLARRARIEGVEFFSRAMSDGSAVTQAFTVTADGQELFGPFELPDAEQTYSFDVAFEAETLRFDLMETTGGNTGAVEIAVYGEFIDG